MPVEMKELDPGPTGLETWEIKLDYTTDPFFGAVIEVQSVLIHDVHPKELCVGRHCVIHNPSDHHMREWPLLWRADRAMFERLCKHGVGHPDPDQLEYWEELGRESEAVHGCDGCCMKPWKVPDSFGPED